MNEKNVEYLLIGGYAVGHHGYVRPTGDLDIWIAVHPQNAERMTQVIQAFGFGEIPKETFLNPSQILRMGIDPVKIEVTTFIDGVHFDECYAERLIDTIDGVTVNIINLKHLWQNKKASGRLKDLADLYRFGREVTHIHFPARAERVEIEAFRFASLPQRIGIRTLAKT